MKDDYNKLCRLLNEIKKSANFQKEMVSQVTEIIEKHMDKEKTEFDPDECYYNF